ncbi:FadR/GntR family transcriptional regulator [Vreelandella olivaria]|uniref:FadR/GntR family transcriptional regulator n=1 Tax=Vreelandella olivaria TaxID=390919 RepID=UPI00201F6D40|nr:FadR/GntR family transcriptional regulator [Halomonas olivaria]
MTTAHRHEIASRKKESLSSLVSNALEEMIRTEQLKVGDKLPTESELGRMFDVSRTVVREAVSHLKSLGVVESRRGVGAFIRRAHASSSFLAQGVSSGTVREILDLLEFRLPIEVEAAGLAAKRRTEEDLARLAENIERFSNNPGNDLAKQEDFEFHYLIGQASKNPVYANFYDSLGDALVPRTRVADRVIPSRIKGYLDRVLEEHRQIYSCISAGDPEGARQAMRLHLSCSYEFYLSRLEQDPGA